MDYSLIQSYIPRLCQIFLCGSHLSNSFKCPDRSLFSFSQTLIFFLHILLNKLPVKLQFIFSWHLESLNCWNCYGILWMSNHLVVIKKNKCIFDLRLFVILLINGLYSFFLLNQETKYNCFCHSYQCAILPSFLTNDSIKDKLILPS